MKAGLVSVSFRKMPWEQVLDLAVQCGLKGIEWGGDVHVPCGDIEHAQLVGKATRERGLEVACYGSYCRMTDEECSDEKIEALVNTAHALGAPLIRVWAGKCGNAEATPEQWNSIRCNTQRLAAVAARVGIEIAFEYHGGTLTDDPLKARQLLEEIGCENVGSLWQPPVGMSVEGCLEGIRTVIGYVRNVHVFSWLADENNEVIRLELAAGAEKWRACMDALTGDRWMLLEFIKDDSLEQLEKDVETLKNWIAGRWNA